MKSLILNQIMNTKLGASILLTMLLADTASRATDLTATWSGSQVIPDNNPTGVAFPFSFSSPGPLYITSVKVDLNIGGTWNGDLYAYLSHGSGFSVLLNRIGRAAGSPYGSDAGGMNIELSDSYTTDVHLATGDPLTGNFAPDARAVNPYTALDADPRTAFLSSFDGLDPNGSWTLFLADAAPLDTSTVLGWKVDVTVVPEPPAPALAGLAALLFAPLPRIRKLVLRR